MSQTLRAIRYSVKWHVLIILTARSPPLALGGATGLVYAAFQLGNGCAWEAAQLAEGFLRKTKSLS